VRLVQWTDILQMEFDVVQPDTVFCAGSKAHDLVTWLQRHAGLVPRAGVSQKNRTPKSLIRWPVTTVALAKALPQDGRGAGKLRSPAAQRVTVRGTASQAG
jgi:hypothetical protein